MAALIACLVAAYDSVGPAANRRASASATDPSSESGTTRSARPQLTASAAGSGSASRASTKARPRPIRAGTSRLAPPSGVKPILEKASRKNADSAATTRSEARAIEQPMPAAGPLTAEITGFRSRRNARISGPLISRNSFSMTERRTNIGSRTESTSGSGEHDCAHAVVRVRRSDQVEQLDRGTGVERIEHVGTVEPDTQNATSALDGHHTTDLLRLPADQPLASRLA